MASVSILSRKSNSIDSVYEKQTVKIDFKYLKIGSNLNNKMNIIGKRVLNKSNSSSIDPKSGITRCYKICFPIYFVTTFQK